LQALSLPLGLHKKAEPIAMPFGVWTCGCPKNHVLDKARICQQQAALSGDLYPTSRGQWMRPGFAPARRNQQHAAGGDAGCRYQFCSNLLAVRRCKSIAAAGHNAGLISIIRF